MEKQTLGIFASRTVYWIRTLPQNWVVQRKMSDFDWLSSRLATEFPSLAHVVLNENGDLKDFLKRMSKTPALMNSPFFEFFFSCTNLKAFYAKKKLEYDRDWLKDLSSLGSRMAKSASDSTNDKTIMSLVKEVNNENKERETKLHLYLEELTLKNGYQLEKISQIKAAAEDIQSIIGSLRERLTDMGEALSDLANSWTDLENKKYFSDLKSTDSRSLTESYSNLKTEVFSWSNSLEKTRSLMRKNVLAPVDAIASLATELNKNLKVRREAVIQVCYSSRVQDKNLDLLARREEKLRAINEHLFAECRKANLSEQYHLEKCLQTIKTITAGTVFCEDEKTDLATTN